MIIGVISDTHGLLRPEAIQYLTGSDLILHAGDIGSPDIITELEKICPVTAIRGNIDHGPWADVFPTTQSIEIANHRVTLLHNLKELDFDPVAVGIDVLVSGHSHNPKIEDIDGVLYLNPGSAGPRRFSLPISLAKLLIEDDMLSTELKEIVP